MPILKYLDVLIGLAVVMVLLSPLVSGITQLILWLLEVRAGRLEVGLKTLIVQVLESALDQFEAAEVTGVPVGSTVNGMPPGPSGSVIVTSNLNAMLRTHKGDLQAGLKIAPPGTVVGPIMLRPRGTQAWSIMSGATDGTGKTTVTYRFDGGSQYAGRTFTALLNPAGGNLAVEIASGTFAGTVLNVAAGAYSYPATVSPVPNPHDLKLTVTNAAGAPVAGCVVTLNFPEDRSFDVASPIHGRVAAKDLARQVLLHPMVARPSFLKYLRWGWNCRGELVEREEFIRILLEFGATKPNLGAILKACGIDDPARALADIRQEAQRLEAEKPEMASHQRLTQAILSSARSGFVGVINTWFDQVMDRTTTEYKFRAQMITVIAAFFVAGFVQLDSVELLRRLSVDDKLRDSLVEQAKVQQTRLETEAKKAPQSDGELQRAKASRDEIESNLSKLRDPQLSLLPDQCVWKGLPQARLMRNPDWAPPFSKTLELAIGSSTYGIEPAWSSDPFSDIESALKNSGAPVTVAHDSRKRYVVSNAKGGTHNMDQLRINVDGHNVAANHAMVSAAIASAPPAGNYTLIAGYKQYPVAISAAATLEQAVAASRAPVAVDAGMLTASTSSARWIELRTNASDPKSNVLKPSEFTRGNAAFEDAFLPGSGKCEAVIDGKAAPIAGCTAAAAKALLTGQGFAVEENGVDYLVLTSHRPGLLQLRGEPGKPASNMLNNERTWTWQWSLMSQPLLGVALTWILLSLGSTFWYDGLKDLLKLRSSMAQKEEQAREDRQKNTAAA